MWLLREPEGDVFSLFLLAMAKRNKSLRMEEIGVCSSGTFSLEIGELGKGVNSPRGPSPTLWMQSSACGTLNLLARPESHSIMTVHQRIVSLLKKLVLTPHHG